MHTFAAVDKSMAERETQRSLIILGLSARARLTFKRKAGASFFIKQFRSVYIYFHADSRTRFAQGQTLKFKSKTAVLRAANYRDSPFRLDISLSRISTLRIFPEIVFGKESTYSIIRGYL